MESKKYTLEQEQIARFAKAMGHPARMAILEFLAKQEIETPKVKYCINRENWKIASMLFSKFFGQCVCKKESCCE